MLITVRTAGLPDGHPLHGWIADVLRLSRVDRLTLEPLTRAGTEAQLVDLLGAPPHQSLVYDVYAASRGNPYFTALLSRGVRPGQHHLPEAFPGDLVAAVTGVWHDCSPEARTLTCLLAVMGGPQPSATLEDVVRDLDLSVAVKEGLAEAQANGLLEATADSRYWFRHPLQAEVLVQTTTEEQRRAWYAALARTGDGPTEDADLPSLETALLQCVRHDRAGAASAAYRWAMRAYELAANAASTPELRRVLRRAIALRSQVPEAVEEPALLWQRLRALASDAGAFAEELEAVEELIALTDPVREPVRLSELLVRRMLVRMVLATAFCSVEEMSRAVELAAADPTSWQFALAQAELAHAAAWWDDPQAGAVAERALTAARAVGHPTALSFALTASAMVTFDAGEPAAAGRLAAEAVDVACTARDWWAYVHAVSWESNAMSDRHGWPEVDYFARRRAQLSELGGPDPYLLILTAVEAGTRLELGDGPGCESLLRGSLVSDPRPIADLRSRLALATLAAYRGRVAEAIAHVDRARELFAGRPHFPNLSLDVTWATVLLEADRPAEAYDVALAAAAATSVPVDMAERLMPLAARALADLLQRAHDHRRSDRALLAALDDLRGRFPTIILEPGEVLGRQAPIGTLREVQLTALQAWYDAETARALGSVDEPAQWDELRSRFIEAQLPWLESYACWRAAEAYLSRGHTGRGEGVRLLRDGYDLAVRLGAQRVRVELTDLGRLVHVRLAVPRARAVRDDPRLAELTPRELEILDLLAAGLTYAQIAANLVISEKTVSSHVSSVLRKTGTANRVELTRLVGRMTPADL